MRYRIGEVPGETGAPVVKTFIGISVFSLLLGIGFVIAGFKGKQPWFVISVILNVSQKSGQPRVMAGEGEERHRKCRRGRLALTRPLPLGHAAGAHLQVDLDHAKWETLPPDLTNQRRHAFGSMIQCPLFGQLSRVSANRINLPVALSRSSGRTWPKPLVQASRVECP